jgi:hypothetical protein
MLYVSWTSLLGDSPIDAKPNRVINKFLNELIDDPFKVIAHYGDLADKLIVSIKNDSAGQSVIIDDFLEDFKDTPIFREYLDFYRTHNVLLLRYILSFLTFGKKVSYVDEKLDARALRSWYQVEDRLEQSALPSYVADLRYVMHWIFRNFEAGEFLPKHGSGSVAERGVWGSEMKNSQFQADPMIAYLYGRPSLETQEVGYSSPTAAPFPLKDRTKSVARLMFVPKDWKKTRSICMEPIDFQWAQQGVRLWYEDYLTACELRNHVDITRQENNQIAAWSGSVNSELDTLDLSSASDSVSLALVKSIFPTKVLKHLLGTRSRMVLVPDQDEPIKVQKYAPMGSALCFPVQSTIYSAIILMVSIAESYGRDLWKGDTITDIDLTNAYMVCYGGRITRWWRPHYHKFLAYGDDLIVDNAITSNVIRALKDLSFQVNEEKSFVGNSAYRESCGKHYCIGYEVTPYRLKVKWFNQRISGEALGSVIDAANLAGEYGFVNLRRHLIGFAMYYGIDRVPQVSGKNPILFVSMDSDQSFAIRCSNPRNQHLKRRNFDLQDYDPSVPIRDRDTHLLYQRDEVSSITVGPQKRRKLSGKYDNYHYLMWWRARYHRRKDPLEGIPMAADTKSVRIKRRWTAV